MKNAINLNECSNVTLLKFEKHMKRNNNTAYFITAAARECGYYICNMICENDPINIRKHNSPKYYMSSRIQSPALFATEKDALACIEEIKDWDIIKKYSLHVCKIEFEPEYKLHKRSDEKIAKYMDDFVKHLNKNVCCDEISEYLKEDDKYFNGKNVKKSFIETINRCSIIHLPIRVNILDDNSVNFIHIRGKNNTTSSSETYETFNGIFPNGVITCYPYLNYPIYADSRNENDIASMSKFVKTLHTKFDKRNIVKIVELSVNKNGKYSWKLIDAD